MRLNMSGTYENLPDRNIVQKMKYELSKPVEIIVRITNELPETMHRWTDNVVVKRKTQNDKH